MESTPTCTPGLARATPHKRRVQYDPAFALAHALRALDAAVYLRRADVGPAIELAQRHAPQASEREQSHVVAIALLVGGKSALAFDAALAHMARWPTDALLASTLLGAFGLFAFSGRDDHDAARLAFMRRLAHTTRQTMRGCCRTWAGPASKPANSTRVWRTPSAASRCAAPTATSRTS